MHTQLDVFVRRCIHTHPNLPVSPLPTSPPNNINVHTAPLLRPARPTAPERNAVARGEFDDDKLAEQLEQSLAILGWVPVPVTRLAANAPGYCTWQDADGTKRAKYSAHFAAIDVVGGGGHDGGGDGGHHDARLALAASAAGSRLSGRPTRHLDVAAHFSELFYVTSVRLECEFAPSWQTIGPLPNVSMHFSVLFRSDSSSPISTNKLNCYHHSPKGLH